jgi:fumarate reductase iron-sulfur subunit
MATDGKKILVKRYLPEKSEPFYQTYELRFFDEMTVLDALNILKDEQDGSLTFRWSCRMGICGSCSAVVNGKPVLMCQTYLRDLPSPVRIEPLRNFPIIKDLVVEIDDVFEKMRGTMPYMTRMKERALEEGEYKQTPEQLEKLKQTSQCIKCMLCYSACPVYGLDKNFIGPAAGALAYRYMADSRESGRGSGKGERMDRVTGKDGVWKCSFVGECSVVCPKRVDPALALQRLKVMGSLRLVKPL